MCRFIAYRGRPILLDELLYQPKNSLIRQSAKAHETEEPLNGDGFGVGWYTPELEEEPGVYLSVRPAWNDRNLRYLARHVRTETLFAHVRAATEGEVSEANCHPFHFGKYLFMHNGEIGEFQRIKRTLRRRLSDPIYDWLRGQTDSEHLFALFLQNLSETPGQPTAALLSTVMVKTIAEIQTMKAQAGITAACYINSVLTDGTVVIAARYVSDPSERASTLYYGEGQSYECKDGVCYMIPGQEGRSVLVVSEKLTERLTDWKEIPTNHIVMVDESVGVTLTAIDDGYRSQAAPLPGLPPAKGFHPKRNMG